MKDLSTKIDELTYTPTEWDRKVLCEIPLEMQYTASVKVEKNTFRNVYEVVVYTVRQKQTKEADREGD